MSSPATCSAEPTVSDAPAQQRPRDARERERVTVRRALIAGLITWALIGGSLAVSLAGAGGQASAAGMLLGLVFAGIVASAWLLTAMAIDLLTHKSISRRRTLWTVAVALFTLISPTFVLGAGG